MARIGPKGELSLRELGVDNVSLLSEGHYRITLDVTVPRGGIDLIPVVTPEVDVAPTRVEDLRFPSVTPRTNGIFDVYMNGTAGPINNGFLFMVTAR